MRRSQGVTLIELLLAILIVIMLASMVLFALQRAQVSARQARTQALIARLHSIIGRQWATYQTRRVPVDARYVTGIVDVDGNVSVNKAARFRLTAIRQTMRLELPDRWEEVSDVANVSPLQDFTTGASWTLATSGEPVRPPPPSAS
ncbi:MAG: prepilin-type N-terminal cleavage/methylation domain-containing protein, partial [Planctomycetota bacterium]|nr:prepilin-type N-terminal cleavage/methylation domain-containing protein [Planctomycetota bacterium]